MSLAASSKVTMNPRHGGLTLRSTPMGYADRQISRSKAGGQHAGRKAGVSAKYNGARKSQGCKISMEQTMKTSAGDTSDECTGQEMTI